MAAFFLDVDLNSGGLGSYPFAYLTTTFAALAAPLCPNRPTAAVEERVPVRSRRSEGGWTVSEWSAYIQNSASPSSRPFQ